MTDFKNFDEVQLSDDLKLTIDSYAKFSEGMTDPGELTELVKAVVFSDPRAGEIILELGTYKGNTAALLAEVMNKQGRSNLIVSVDAFDMVVPGTVNPRGSLQAWLDNNTQWKEKTIMIRGFTNKVGSFIRPECASLLFIDAYHEYDSVCEDIRLYLPSVKKGGLIFVDDYNEKLFPGVFNATNELLVNNKTVETIRLSYYAIFRKL